MPLLILWLGCPTLDYAKWCFLHLGDLTYWREILPFSEAWSCLVLSLMMREGFLSFYILFDVGVLLMLPCVIHFSLMPVQCSVCGDPDCAWEFITMCLCKVTIDPIMLKKELCMGKICCAKNEGLGTLWSKGFCWWGYLLAFEAKMCSNLRKIAYLLNSRTSCANEWACFGSSWQWLSSFCSIVAISGSPVGVDAFVSWSCLWIGAGFGTWLPSSFLIPPFDRLSRGNWTFLVLWAETCSSDWILSIQVSFCTMIASRLVVPSFELCFDHLAVALLLLKDFCL